MTQLWKTIEQYPSYEVSNTGLVRKKVSGKEPNQHKTAKGYLRVTLWNNGIGNKKMVHRLVAEAFIENPNPAEFTQVNHKNSCKTDNRVENLEWCSGEYNVRHMIANGHKTLAKLDYRKAGEIRELLLLGAKVERIAEKYGVSPKTIYEIKSGKRWSWIGNASEYLYDEDK